MIGKNKFRNMLSRYSENSQYEYALDNIRVNGEAKGCRGYICNPSTGKVVYITTVPIAAPWAVGKMMFRLADGVGVDGDPLDSWHKPQWVEISKFIPAVCAELDSENPLLTF